jgi:hypothetical protein
VKHVLRGTWYVVRSGKDRGPAVSTIPHSCPLERTTHYAPRTTASRRLACTTHHAPRTTASRRLARTTHHAPRTTASRRRASCG